MAVILICAVGVLPINAYASALETDEAEDGIEYEEPLDPDTDIKFEPGKATNRTAAKSALADMHGIYVFRDAFITQERLIKEREKNDLYRIEDVVLKCDQTTADYEQIVSDVLTSETDRYIKEVHVKSGTDNTRFYWVCCILISICVLCVALLIEKSIKRKHREGMINGRTDIEQYHGSSEGE